MGFQLPDDDYVSIGGGTYSILKGRVMEALQNADPTDIVVFIAGSNDVRQTMWGDQLPKNHLDAFLNAAERTKATFIMFSSPPTPCPGVIRRRKTKQGHKHPLFNVWCPHSPCHHEDACWNIAKEITLYLQNGLRFPQFRFLDLTTEQKPQSPTFREKFDPKGNDVHFSVKFANEFVHTEFLNTAFFTKNVCVKAV